MVQIHDEQRSIQMTAYVHKNSAQASNVITNNGSKNSKCRPESDTQWEEAATMRTVQITTTCTKGEREREREREKLGTQVLILPIMERKSFSVNRNICIKWTIQITTTRKTPPTFTCLALKEVLLLYAGMLSLIKLFKPKEETVIARLHIGHSFFTHSFLLKGEEPPVCIGCDQRLTIEQFYIIVQILLKQERAILQPSLCFIWRKDLLTI